jgi:hypothetical protein
MSSVPDPESDPDPFVSMPPGTGSVVILYGSGSFYQKEEKKISNIDFCC